MQIVGNHICATRSGASWLVPTVLVMTQAATRVYRLLNLLSNNEFTILYATLGRPGDRVNRWVTSDQVADVFLGRVSEARFGAKRLSRGRRVFGVGKIVAPDKVIAAHGVVVVAAVVAIAIASKPNN
jgi:hypothetical protein